MQGLNTQVSPIAARSLPKLIGLMVHSGAVRKPAHGRRRRHDVSILPETRPLSDVSGDWIWLRRWLMPAALVASLYGWAVLVSTFIDPGSIGVNHIAPGTDWMVFYGAVRSALAGHLQLIMNGDDFTAYLNRDFADWLSVPLQFRPWFYPPSFLVLLLPFAPLGLVGSYVAF